ncbi:hypothetical protein NpNSSI1_00001048 [Neofusicoccum parvum]|nr:hypothetical protein NpNSSI1_00001048 [Neofusicoccum parvum]
MILPWKIKERMQRLTEAKLFNHLTIILHHNGLTRAEKAEGRRAEFLLRVAAAEAFRPVQLEEQVAQRAEKEAHPREAEVAFHKAGAVEAVQHRLEGEGEALQTEAGEVFRKEGEGAGCQAAAVAAELLLLRQLVVEREEQLVGFQPEAEVGERLVEFQLEVEVEVEPLEVFRPGEAVEEHFRQVAEED